MADFDRKKVALMYPSATMYQPMKIHASTDAQLKDACASGEWFGQLKKDGAWYMYEHKGVSCSDGIQFYDYLFGRTVSKKTGLLTEKKDNVPHIISALANNLPANTILIGEIYYPGKSSKDTVSIMGCLPDKAIQRQSNGYGLIHYYIHDILMYGGVDLVKNKATNEQRYAILKKIYYLHELDKYSFIELAEVWEDNLYERIGNALDSGEEGMVLKMKNGVYEPDKRPQTNIKAKKVDYIDAILMGFEEPTKFYYGKDITNWEYWYNNDSGELVKGLFADHVEHQPVTKAYFMGWHNARIKIGAYDKNGKLVEIGTIHSGISDDLKERFTIMPSLYLNTVCKIQCMEKDNKEMTLRHGFFKGFHEDKNAEDCTLESIFN